MASRGNPARFIVTMIAAGIDSMPEGRNESGVSGV